MRQTFQPCGHTGRGHYCHRCREAARVLAQAQLEAHPGAKKALEVEARRMLGTAKVDLVLVEEYVTRQRLGEAQPVDPSKSLKRRIERAVNRALAVDGIAHEERLEVIRTEVAKIIKEEELINFGVDYAPVGQGDKTVAAVVAHTNDGTTAFTHIIHMDHRPEQRARLEPPE